MADPISLDAYRKRRAGWEQCSKPSLGLVTPAAPVEPAYVAAEPGRVILGFTDHAELVLSPAHARIWAERLAAFADTAEAMAKEGGG